MLGLGIPSSVKLSIIGAIRRSAYLSEVGLLKMVFESDKRVERPTNLHLTRYLK